MKTRRIAAKKTSGKMAARKAEPEAAVAARLAKARELEALDRAGPTSAKRSGATTLQRNSNFPNTYIKQIAVQLDDPDHPLTLTWTGPRAAQQESGPFRSSPGAGLRGLNCDSTTTSRRSGSMCTPKGTHTVSGFQSRLNSDARATYVTWFVRARGIALHYFPSVPRYAASHGCVRIEQKRVAQLVQSNSRAGLTNVVVSGTWTKPARQY